MRMSQTSLKDADDAADLKEETDTLTDLFKKALGNDKLTVKVEKLKNENLASIITLSPRKADVCRI